MHYRAAIDFLFSFLNYEVISFEYRRDFNLKRMGLLLNWVGRPDREFTSILIGGTNAKGSVTNFLSDLLRSSGQKTGMYTSPHLVSPRERIRLNGKMIPEKKFAKLVTKLKSVIEKKRKETGALGPITFFEMFTLLAILYFAEEKVRFGVFEVGMGGRLDATNILNAALTILTPIDLDHEKHLGKTVTQIALEKAALIKPRGQVVIGHQNPDALRVISRELKQKKATGFFLGKEFKSKNKKITATGSSFDFSMNEISVKGLNIKLPGRHQIDNAACAIAAVKVLYGQDLVRANEIDFDASLSPRPHKGERVRVRGNLTAQLCHPEQREGSSVWRKLHERSEIIDPSTFACMAGLRMTKASKIRYSLANSFWPGRFEIVKRGSQTIILDGAHNEHAMRKFSNTVRKFFPLEKKIVMFGISRDKNITRVLASLCQIADCVIATKSQNSRAREPKLILEELNRLHFKKQTFWAPNLKEAIQIADSLESRKSILLVTGSLFLIGEAREFFKCRQFV